MKLLHKIFMLIISTILFILYIIKTNNNTIESFASLNVAEYYRGTTNKTRQGYTCWNWTHSGIQNKYRPSGNINIENADQVKNYCRALGESYIWCYYENPKNGKIAWDKCSPNSYLSDESQLRAAKSGSTSSAESDAKNKLLEKLKTGFSISSPSNVDNAISKIKDKYSNETNVIFSKLKNGLKNDLNIKKPSSANNAVRRIKTKHKGKINTIKNDVLSLLKSTFGIGGNDIDNTVNRIYLDHSNKTDKLNKQLSNTRKDYNNAVNTISSLKTELDKNIVLMDEYDRKINDYEKLLYSNYKYNKMVDDYGASKENCITSCKNETKYTDKVCETSCENWDKTKTYNYSNITPETKEDFGNNIVKMY